MGVRYPLAPGGIATPQGVVKVYHVDERFNHFYTAFCRMLFHRQSVPCLGDPTLALICVERTWDIPDTFPSIHWGKGVAAVVRATRRAALRLGSLRSSLRVDGSEVCGLRPVCLWRG